MDDIVIFVQTVGADDEGSGVLYGGIARTSSMTHEDNSVNWWVNLAASTIATTVNNSIKTAAIDAVTNAGFTIGMLNKKTLIGAAEGL